MPYLEQALRCSKGENRFQDYDMRAYQSMAMANMLLGKYDTAVEFLDQIVVGLGNENVSAKTWRYLAECWGGTRLGKGDQSKSLMYLARAEAAINGDAAEEGEIAAARATFQLFAGDYQGAQRSFETAISIAKQCNNAESLSKNQAYLADVFLTVGKVEDALEMAEGALKNAESVPGYYGELEATYYLGMVHLHAGNSREAIRLLTKSADISLKIGEYTGLCWALTFLSLAYDANDDMDGALKAASRSYECAQTTESSFIMLNGISGLLHAKIRRGEMEDVERLYEKGVMIQKDFNWGMHSSTRCLLTAAMAEYQAAKGDWANSVKLFEESFHLAEGTPNGLLLEALGRTWYGKFLETRGNANEAKAQFVRAIELYRSLRNMVQADKIRKAHHL
jgi:tetratricopeptide (TPR) repeat protein